MRMGTIAAALFFTVSAVALAVWLGRPESEIPVRNNISSPDVDAPEVSPTGPWPKAAIEEREYDFGQMSPGEELSHVFTIRNEGEAPLKLVQGESTCKCTVGELADGDVPPGGSVDVTLTWHAEQPMPLFSQSVQIWTNDPEETNRPIRLTVVGAVEEQVRLAPEGDWNVGNVAHGKPAEVSGVIFSSRYDEFQITELETPGEAVTAEAKPLSEEELATYGARSGYRIEVKVLPSSDVGPFSEKLTVGTDIDGGTKMAVQLAGVRRGPWQILPRPGVKWLSKAQALDLGRFKAAKGAAAELLLFVSRGEDEAGVQLETVEVEPDFLKVTVAKDENFADPERARFRIGVEVPPGLPPAARIGKNAGTVRLKTNQPGSAEIVIRVGFVSLGT